MFCLLDNIIFSLQKGGGASVVWQQHIQRLLQERDVECKFIEYISAETNLFRRDLDIPIDLIAQKKAFLIFLKRYLDISEGMDIPFIFHSSHYRLCTHPNAINITTVHDFTYEYYIHGIRQKVHSWQKKHAIEKAQGIICISESTKRDLLHFLPFINESKIRVIHNGVDERFQILGQYEELIKLPFSKYGFILYVGDRRNLYKNFNLVVNVCKKSNMPLVMIGGGSLSHDETLLLDANLGKSSYYLATGISVEVLNEIYNKAFALIYPSLYEGFGIPVIEAQKAGCPVIAYSHSSIPEIIGTSRYALEHISVDSVCEAVSYLKNRSGERGNVVADGLENAKRFSWEKTYNDTIKFYRELYYEE